MLSAALCHTLPIDNLMELPMTTPHNAVVWTEIRVTDLHKAMAFYNAVLDTQLILNTDMGPAPVAVFPYATGEGTSGQLTEGTPAAPGTGNIVHLSVTGPLSAARDRLIAAGGQAHSPDIEIPGGFFFYASDPDGNSIGLFQAKG